MRQTLDCKYFDPRYRVYAVLNLLNDDERLIGIEIDYTKRRSQVHQDVTLRSIARYNNLKVLTTSGSKDKPSGIPSSVPDWTVANTFIFGSASG